MSSRQATATAPFGEYDGKSLGPKIYRRPANPGQEADFQALTAHDGVPLKRTLSAMSLMALGIGDIIGAGIFVLTGHAAAANAGPAISLSFVLGGIACALRGAVLRRDGVDRADLGQRLYLCLCHHGRAHRLDHRLGPDPGICARRHHGRDRLVRLCGELSQGHRHHAAGRSGRAPFDYDPALGRLAGDRRAHQRSRHGGDRRRDGAAGRSASANRRGSTTSSWSSSSRSSRSSSWSASGTSAPPTG